MGTVVRPGLSPTTAKELDEYWAGLRRSSPDPKARNATSTTLFTILNTLTWIPYVPLSALYGSYLTVKYLVTPRAFPKWTWDRMIRNRLNKLWNELTAAWLDPMELPEEGTGRPEVTKIFHEQAEVKGEISIQVIEILPVGEEFRHGIAVNPHVEAVVRPGFWVTPNVSLGKGTERAKEGEKVFLHIHGGGYRRGHPLWSILPHALVTSTQIRLLSTNYRKPLLAHTAFPAPLLDALAAYVHLLQLGFQPANIHIVGKSAGGHLAMMLSRYLADIDLPQPGSLISMAPWSDLFLSSPSYIRHKGFDTLTPSKLVPAVKSAVRWYTPEALDDPYFVPMNAKPEQWEYLRDTKVYMIVGTRELFEDEINITAKNMKAAGVEVHVREDIDGLHTSALSDPPVLAVFLKDVRELLEVGK